jgi:hypothetical protein
MQSRGTSSVRWYARRGLRAHGGLTRTGRRSGPAAVSASIVCPIRPSDPHDPTRDRATPQLGLDRSYRALLQVPTLGRVITSMQLARIAQSMVGVALVLFTLAEYDSPALAGIVTFASLFPGLRIAPIAGALLDRHGRIRLMALDYVVALVSLVLIGALAIAGLLPPALLVLITISPRDAILSVVGLRTLLIMKSHLWERVNAVD